MTIPTNTATTEPIALYLSSFFLSALFHQVIAGNMNCYQMLHIESMSDSAGVFLGIFILIPTTQGEQILDALVT